MKKILLGLGLAGLLAMNASATLVLVDDFDDVQGPVSISAAGTNSSAFLNNGLGFDRQIFITWISGLVNTTLVDGGPTGTWQQSTGATSSNDAGAVYQLAGGGGTIDLTGLNFIRIRVDGVDVLGGDLEMFITTGSGTFTTGTKAITPLVPPGAPFLLTFLTAEFGAVDLTDVQSFGFRALGLNNIDLTLDDLEYDFTTGCGGPSEPPCPVVPEPATMAMMGIGLLGLGFLGRRMRK